MIYHTIDLTHVANHQDILKSSKSGSMQKLASQFERTILRFEEMMFELPNAQSYFEEIFQQMKGIAEYNNCI